MPAARIPLNKGKSATVPASGTVTITLGPAVGPPQWHVTKWSVKTNRRGLPPIPTCDIFLNSQDDDGYQESTYDGSSDASDVDVTVFKGGQIIAVWTGAQAGDVATLSLYGEQVTPS